MFFIRKAKNGLCQKANGFDSIKDKASSIQGIMKLTKVQKIEIVLYEPALQDKRFFNSTVTKNLDELKDIFNKVYTDNLFGQD